MKIRINVTKEILAKTKMCRSGTDDIVKNCAIAVACREIFPCVSVGADYVKDLKLGLMAEMPTVAKSFIMAFDSREPKERLKMNPISFEIEVPDSVIDKIGISEVDRILSESKTLERA